MGAKLLRAVSQNKLILKTEQIVYIIDIET